MNEFHFSYMRNANDIGAPRGGLGVPIASQGFVTGPGTPGIVVQAPQFEGVENVAFERFVFGVTTTNVNQVNNTYHLSDNVSKVLGTHTLRVGGDFQYAQVDIDPNAQFNGTFSFQGTETGSDFADFLLGAPSGYIQAAGTPFFIRNKYAGAFAQDSWRIGANLTLNYGLRYDFMEPWYDKFNQIQTFFPGRSRSSFPARRRVRVPGRRGIPRTLVAGAEQILTASRRRVRAVVHGRPAEGAVRRRGTEQHPIELWHLLHGHSRALGRHHVQHPAVRRRTI